MIYKKYITKAGDTYESISKKLYGLQDSANVIEKLNGLPGDIVEGLNLTVPSQGNPPTSGSALPRVVIGDAEFVIFERLSNSSSMTGVATAYLTIVFDPKDKDHVTYFKNCENALVYINNEKKLTGEIKSIVPMSDSSNQLWMIGIKSHAGILLDTHVPKTFFPLEYLNVTYAEIINRICEGFGVGVVIDDSVGGALDVLVDNNYEVSASAGLQETPFDFITRLVSSRSLNVSDTVDGDVFIYKYQKEDSVLSIIEGLTAGLTVVSALFNYDSLHKGYHVFSQFGESDNYAVSLFDAFPLPLHKNINLPNSSSGNIAEFSKWMLCRHIGNAVKVVVSLPYFSFEGVTLKKGNIVNFKAPSIGIFEETEFIIEKITETQTRLELTEIVLTIPGAYTGEVPDSLPLLKSV